VHWLPILVNFNSMPKGKLRARTIRRRLANSANGGSNQSRLAMRNIRPMQISSNPRMRHKFRFAAGSSGAGTYTISNLNVLTACGTICYGSNDLVAIFSSFKINFIEMWAMAGSVPATLAISWNGGPVFVTNAKFQILVSVQHILLIYWHVRLRILMPLFGRRVLAILFSC